ncbi:MAG: hypothetical protein AMS24_05190 [Chlamydiae bacterium SM23_39]|nr:MAG: hypothetical protein AMS24_05190 [Chlamydiae bacterium SM23_39]
MLKGLGCLKNILKKSFNITPKIKTYKTFIPTFQLDAQIIDIKIIIKIGLSIRLKILKNLSKKGDFIFCMNSIKLNSKKWISFIILKIIFLNEKYKLFLF